MDNFLITISHAWIPVLIVSIIITLIYFFVVRSQYKLVHKDNYAFDYLKQDTLEMKKTKDHYTGTHTDKRKKTNNNNK